MKLNILLLLFTGMTLNGKLYVKDFYSNGNIKDEGWKDGEVKTDYWFYYYENGKKKEEGSYKNNIRSKYWKFYFADGNRQMEGRFENGLAKDWWIFYKDNSVMKKAEYSGGKQNGYALYYANGTLTKAEKYKDDIKIGEWTDYASFKRDN